MTELDDDAEDQPVDASDVVGTSASTTSRPPPEKSIVDELTTFGLTFGVLAATSSALAYGLLEEGYSFYFSRFGVNPEDAGLDRPALLSQALWLPLAALLIEVGVLVVGALVVLAVAVLVVSIRRMRLTNLGFGYTYRQVSAATKRRFFRRGVVVPVLLAMVVVASITDYTNVHDAVGRQADWARDGVVFTAVKPLFSYGFLPISWRPAFELKLRSEHVDVDWHDHMPSDWVGGSRCLVLLNEPAAYAIVYDVRYRYVWRVPVADATFRVRLDQKSDTDLLTCARERR